MWYRSRRVAWGSWLMCDDEGEDDDADGIAAEELPW